MSAKVSRRSFLRWAGLAGSTAIIAACAPKPAVQPTAAPTQPPPPTPDESATQAFLSAKATEDAIAAQAKADEEAKKILEMNADQLKAYNEQSEAQAKAAGKTVIELLSAYSTVADDNTQPIFWIDKAFMEKNESIYVHYTPAGAYSGSFNETIMMRIASGDPPDAILHYSSPIAYAARGTCLQLDDLIAAGSPMSRTDIVDSAWQCVTWQGKTWGVPLSGSHDAMWYNVDVLQQNGIPTDRDKLPKTLDDVKALSAKLTKYEGDTLKLCGETPWVQMWGFPGMVVANGGLLWDGEKYSINHPKNAELVKYWIDWIDEMYKGDIDKLKAQGTFGDPYPGTLFANKVQVMESAGLWSLTHYPPEINIQIDVMPTGPSGTRHATSNYPNLMFIPTGAKHIKEGFQLISYFATEGAVEWWDRWSDVPYWTKLPPDKAPKDLIARVGQEKALEFTKFARDYLSEVVVQWNSPIEDLATDEIFRAVDQALHKKIEPQAALDKAQEIVKAKLDEVLAGGGQ